MPLCTNTDGSLPAIHINKKTFELAQELEPIIEAMQDGGEITLVVQHGWVAIIGTFIRRIRTKMKGNHH
jgi:hypothetical protein